MKQLSLIFFSLAILLTYACSHSIKIATDDEKKVKICLSMELLDKPIDSLPMDPISIDSLKLNDECLDVYVTYGGGCGEVKFNMYYTNMVQNSFPPQTALYLSFEDNDPCRAIETRKLSFLLEPFVEYAKNGGIWLNLGKNENQRFLYKTED